MSALPAVPPFVVAEAVEALPSRLRKKLDETVAKAAGWPVSTVDSGVVVTVDDATSVTLSVPVSASSDVVCTCLMAPKCAHRAAVLSLAPTAEFEPPADDGPARDAPPAGDGPAQPAGAGPAQPAAGAGPAEAAVVEAFGPAEVAAAGSLWAAGSAVLARGLAGAGAVQQAVLLRAAHEARALGMHRASAAAVRVVQAARAAHAEDPAFRLADLVGALHELLEVSHRIRRGVGAAASLRGVARRAYAERGDLRLYGVCCVPVLDSTGYAGAVTYLSAPDGALYQVNDVTPGGLELARGRPDNPVRIGEARLTFRELGRAGLFVSAAKASADGRLSNAGTVRAVRGSGRGWTEDPLAGFWRRPLAEQVAAYHEALRLPVEERPAGHDLAFLVGHTGEVEAAEVRFDTVGGQPVRLVAPTDDPGLPYLRNLRMLAEVAGELRVVGRFAGDGRVAVLAAAWPGLPNGHVDLGVDVVIREWLTAAPASTTPDEGTANGGTAPKSDDPAGGDPPAAGGESAAGGDTAAGGEAADRGLAGGDSAGGDSPAGAEAGGEAVDRGAAGGDSAAPGGQAGGGAEDRGAAGIGGAAVGGGVAVWGPPPELPLYLLSRRVQRTVEGGALAAAGAPRDAARLTAAGLPTAAGLAQSLDRLAVDRPRDEFGRPAGHTDELATTWLSAAAYLEAVSARVATDTWLAAAA